MCGCTCVFFSRLCDTFEVVTVVVVVLTSAVDILFVSGVVFMIVQVITFNFSNIKCV